MATTDVERLVVSLEASIRGFERAMNKANGVTENTARKVERRFATMNKRMDTSFAALSRGIGTAFASAAALRGAQQLIDASTRIENSLKVAGLAGDELDRVYSRLFASAQKNAAPLEALTELYGRASLVQKELGVNTEELLGFTDNIAVALRVSGKSASESSGALLQLSQALGSGIVRAEEFNSILEGALPVAQAAAAGLKEAGGSVAKLRQLVVDGKVSSEAFFRAFEAGSVILTEKVASAEMTVSQGFVRLQNVLIDAAGKFNKATGASDAASSSLVRLAGVIEQIGDYFEKNGSKIKPFLDLLGAIDRFDPGDLREKLGLGAIDDFLEGTSLIEGRFGFASQQIQAEAAAMDAAIGDVEYAIRGVALASEGIVSDQASAKILGIIDDLFRQKVTTDEAKAALLALGAASPDTSGITGQLANLLGSLQALKSGAIEAFNAVANVAGLPQSYAGQDGAGPPKPTVKPVSLTDYKTPTKTGGGKKSGADRFNDAIAAQERETQALQRKTQLLAQLNPLVNDYGFALERMNAQIELENAAKAAGLALDGPRLKKIEEMSTAYGMATAEAARLAEAQDLVRQSADDLAQAGRAALDTIVDGFLEGKDAGEIFNSVLKDLAKSLINMGLNSIGGGMKMGGFNPLGFLGGMFGFASGTANTGGVRGQPRGVVHGQEAVIPLPAGGNVPVDLRLPAIPAVGGGAGGALTVHVVSDDEKFSAYVTDKAGAVVAQASPSIVGASVNQSNKSAPAAVARYQQQRGGSDYRTS